MKVKHGINGTVLVLVVAGILIALNVIGSQVFTRADLTEGKEFTISDATKRVLERLDDVVQVKMFFSKKLPPQLVSLEQNLEDVLKEYEIYSDGNIQVQYIDPSESEEARAAAQAAGVPQLQMNLVEQDQFQITTVFLGMGIEYAGKTEVIPVIQDLSTFEYDMTSAVLKLTNSKRPALGVLAGNDERDLDTEMQGIRDLLQTSLDIRTVDLKDGAIPVPRDLDALIVVGSKLVSSRELYEIDQFVMGGGNVFFNLDVVSMGEVEGLSATPRLSGFEELLSFYGVELENALALEHPQYSAQAQFSQGYTAYRVQYPFWPRSKQGLLDKTHPITAGLEALTLPWTAPMSLTVPGDEVAARLREEAGSEPLDLTANQPGVTGTVLTRTTERGWKQTGPYDLNPQSPRLRAPSSTETSRPLAVALTGSFRSFFADKEVPERPAGPDGAPNLAPNDSTLSASIETQVVVVGSSQFLTDQFMRMFPENSLFAQNALDWMTVGNDLIEIRSRGATARPIEELSQSRKNLIRYLNIFGVPALVVLIGILWNKSRKRARQRIRDQYQAQTV